MAPSYSLVTSVIVVGWLYFPVRQWVWSKLFHRKRYALEEWMPLLLGHFMNVDQKSDQDLWEKVLNDVFRPLSIKVKQKTITTSKVIDKGTRMRPPCPVAVWSFTMQIKAIAYFLMMISASRRRFLVSAKRP